eukprot:TRINITY_DN3288_c0_g1_i1.p1 TRINITY_DN3288_c0_g1~~TRINITY_DN3288_c0_g1_i1.p1  ORF type:complete len:133 (-),score=36.60 TRINITY_DN3288_c0_g1_i1:157-555(-)
MSEAQEQSHPSLAEDAQPLEEEIQESASPSVEAEKKKKKKKKPAAATQAPEEEYQYTYEQELNWCIEQLQLGLKRPGVTPDQAAESNRVIKLLSSAKTPLPKKRALMHITFGDYRRYMREMGIKPDKIQSDS